MSIDGTAWRGAARRWLRLAAAITVTGWLGGAAGCSSSSDSSEPPPPAGALDTTFNPPLGYALYSSRTDNRDRGTKLALQADGKIVVAAYSNNGKNNDLLVLRYGPSGTLDPGFGEGGIFFFVQDGDQMPFGLALQPDGKIVVVGRTQTSGNNDVLILRLTPEGSLDASFGSGGVVVYVGPGGATDTGRGVAVQPDGKILVSCESFNGKQKDAILLRYNADGTPDPSFGTAGVAKYSGSGQGDTYGFGIALQPDGKILQTGNGVFGTKTKQDVLLLRYGPEGTLDTTFGVEGSFTYSSPDDYDDFGDLVALQPDGKILVVGGLREGSNSNVLVLRCDAAGKLDDGFGTNGVVSLGSTDDYDYAWGLALQKDGRIVVAGTTSVAGVYRAAVYRLNTDGSLDERFGTAGVFGYSAPENNNAVSYSAAVQTDGRIVVSGYQHTLDSDDNVLVFRLTP